MMCGLISVAARQKKQWRYTSKNSRIKVTKVGGNVRMKKKESGMSSRSQNAKGGASLVRVGVLVLR